MPTFRQMRRSIAAVLLVAYLPACHHWVRPKDMTPQQYVTAKHPGKVRVTLTDGSRFVLGEPWVSADSIGGRLIEPYLGGGDFAWSSPRSSVILFEVSKLDAEATAGAVAVVVGIPLAVLVFVAVNEFELVCDDPICR